MPDIQAGEVEITTEEALLKKTQKHMYTEQIGGQVDDLGREHEESEYIHLGRS